MLDANIVGLRLVRDDARDTSGDEMSCAQDDDLPCLIAGSCRCSIQDSSADVMQLIPFAFLRALLREKLRWRQQALCIGHRGHEHGTCFRNGLTCLPPEVMERGGATAGTNKFMLPPKVFVAGAFHGHLLRHSSLSLVNLPAVLHTIVP